MHEITRLDHPLSPLYGRFKVRLLAIVDDRGLGVPLHGWQVNGHAQTRFQNVQTVNGRRVGVGLFRVAVHDEVELARQVINDGHFLGLHQQNVRTPQGVWRTRMGQLFLNVADRVVTKITRKPPTETGHIRLDRHFEALLVSRHEIKRVTVIDFDNLSLGDDFGFCVRAKSCGSQHGAGGQTNEAVAPESLTPDD